MKDIIDSYQQMSSEFEKSLKERSSDEIEYDKTVIKELRKGRSMKKALKIAAKKYPNEALQYDDQSIGDIQAYYEYLLNHEDIKDKIKRITN